MPRRTSFWSALNAALGGLAAIVTAGTGLYLALRTEPTTIPTTNVTAIAPPTTSSPANEPPAGTIYDRTPWLGIEFRQDGKTIPLHSVDEAWDQLNVPLATGPFEIFITRHADEPNVGILAWHDDSIFKYAGPESLELVGSGIAGGRFAVPILYLDKEGFNYYDNERLKRVADDKYSILVSSVGTGDVELPLGRFAGPIHLIIFRAPQGFDRTVPRRDFEMFTLKR